MTNSYVPDGATLLEIFRKTALRKLNDEKSRQAIKSGRLMMPYYSGRAQECIPSTISACLNDGDCICTIYRGIHDMLAKGTPLKNLWAEIADRVDSNWKGKDGQIYLTYPGNGIMATTGIVGTSIGYGMPGAQVDGNEPDHVYAVAKEAIASPRAGPTLIEATNFRFHGHVFGDADEYKDKERNKAMAPDPYPRFRAQLIADGHASKEQVSTMEDEIEAAMAFALTSPFPGVAELKRDNSAEVIELRTIAPWDRETAVASLKKTRRLIIAHKAVKPFGIGAQISADVYNALFDQIKAPIERVGANFPICRGAVPSRSRLYARHAGKGSWKRPRWWSKAEDKGGGRSGSGFTRTPVLRAAQEI